MTRQHRSAGTAAGAAMFDVIVETAATFFKLRAAGARIGATTPTGAGLWGLLRSLKEGGPQTVPQLARARPVARQRIQALANEMAADGLIEFVDNPAHKRSKLLRLTPKGAAAFDNLSGRIMELSERLARDLGDADLRTTARVLKALRERLDDLANRGEV